MSTSLSRFLAHLNETTLLASLPIVPDNAHIARRRRRDFSSACASAVATKVHHDDSFRWDNSNERLSSIPALPHRMKADPTPHEEKSPNDVVVVILSNDHDLHCVDPSSSSSCASVSSKSTPPRQPRRRASLEMSWKTAE